MAKHDEVRHNHEGKVCRVIYAGFSQTAPHYHLFKCLALSDPPRRVVELIPFDRMRFSEDSKARRNGCSMRNCLSDATMMNEKGSRAYCDLHTERVSPKRHPCPWTSIKVCHRVLRLDDGRPCPTCAAFKKAAL